jgi:DNA polymerase-3 subunit delta
LSFFLQISVLESLAPLLQSKQNFPPVLLMFGEEDFLLDEAFHALVEAALERNGMEQFNFDSFDGSDIAPESLVEMASAFPMMAERRIVAVRHFEKMNMGRSKDAEKKSPLAAYIRNPSPSTLLILTAQADELNGLKSALTNPKQRDKAKKKISALKFPYNALIERAEWIEFPKLYDRELPSWAAKRFKEAGREIEPDACELLVAQAGESLRDLHNEIQKILTFAPDKRKLSRDDISEVIGVSKNYNVFELQRAVGERRLEKALEITRQMLVVDRRELLIVSMLTRYFLTLWKLTEAAQQTQNAFELGKAIDISPFFVPEYLAALKRYSRAEIERAFYALCDADVSIKTSSSEAGELALQKMLMRVMN